MSRLHTFLTVVLMGIFGLVAAVPEYTALARELIRQERSIEGQSCSPANSTCVLAYTRCNEETRTCECDRNVSIGMKMQLYPEVVECIPLNYTSVTGKCLPTVPDMCSVLVPGSFCDISKRRLDRQINEMTCSCAIGGVYPNCTVQIGTLCTTNETCAKDVANSFCGNFTDGFGSCQCGGQENKTFVASEDNTKCRATNCAANPCRGDVNASSCRDIPDGFECFCKNNTKGRSHTFDMNGICCDQDRVPCEDFSKCISISDLCNGLVDCNDCSDEKKFYCTGGIPDSPRCAAKAKVSLLIPVIPVIQQTTVAPTEPEVTTSPETQPSQPLPVASAPVGMGQVGGMWAPGQIGQQQGFFNPFQNAGMQPQAPANWGNHMMG